MTENKSFVFRFDDVEVRDREFVLAKAGEVLPVEPKAFRVLQYLLRNPHKLVTKDELLDAVWRDVSVSENSVARAVAQLRRLLGDDLREPRYIATVPTVGYRFVCHVEVAEDSPATTNTVNADEIVKAIPLDPRIGSDSIMRSRWLPAVAVGGVVLGAFLLIAWWRWSRSSPVVDSVTQLTDDGQIKSGRLATDGIRIYFNEGAPLSQKMGQVSIKGGPTVRVESRLVNPSIAAVKRDGSELIVQAGGGTNLAYPLWAMPLPAGEPRRLGSVEVDAAGISQDGHVLFAVGTDLFIADEDGSNPRKLISLSGRVASVETSPDGQRVLLELDTKGDSTFDTFEMAADGAGVREIRTASPDECCFHWSWDGTSVLYSSKAGNRWDIWTLPVHAELFRNSTRPSRVTTGPLSFSGGAIASRNGKQIFAIASKQHGELLRYDLKLHQFLPLLSGISATDATFSDDGNWVAYLSYPDHTVWRSRSDGTDRMQLTFPPLEAQTPFISPDATRVVYTTDSGSFLIDMNGGSPQQIFEAGINPMWSPDGKSIVVTVPSPGNDYSMQIIDTRTRKASFVPASEGKGGGFWLSPQTLLACNATQTKLLRLDLNTKKWTDFLAGTFVHWINSPDRKYVYIATGGTEPSVQRIRVSNGQVETIVSLKDFAGVTNFGWTQLRVAADGSPTLTRALDTQEIYALQVR
jgi:DNA-binding winged helix-turn-helix (wHTH) protein